MKVLGGDNSFKQQRVDTPRQQENVVNAKKSGEEAASKAPAKTAENVAVSGLGREVAKVSARVKAAPDIRRQKVEAVKEKIDSGEYQVSSEKIAGKIIEGIIYGRGGK